MRLLIGLLIIVALTLIVSSRKWWAYRRYPLLAILTAGGWITVLVGFLVGDHSLEILHSKDSELLTPLIFFGLGWAGMMIGLQADLRFRKMIPWQVFQLILFDLLLTLPVIGVLSFLYLFYASWGATHWEIVLYSSLFAVVLLGWTAEVRSLKLSSRSLGADEIRLLQVSSGLGSLTAVLLFGLIAKLLSSSNEDLLIATSVTKFSFSVGLVILLAAVVALSGRWLIGIVGRKEPEFLVLFFGLVALSSGGAVALGFSPLFVSMLSGIAIANLSGRDLIRFKRFIIEAERPIAIALLLIAGMWATPYLGKMELLLIGVILIGKALSKIILPRMTMSEELLLRSGKATKRLGYFRQSPLALILAVDYLFQNNARIVTKAPLISPEQILSILILSGVLSHLATYFYAQLQKRSHAT